MAGYNYTAGMSNNAVNAYNQGIKPLSKITIVDLKNAGVTISKSFAIWLAKNNYWNPCEWHHSGGTWFNKVNFYDPFDLAELLPDLNIDKLKLKYKNQEKAEGQPVEGTFSVWGGTRNYPKIIEQQNFTGTKVGNWIYLDNGGRKKADGNSISWNYKK